MAPKILCPVALACASAGIIIGVVTCPVSASCSPSGSSDSPRTSLFLALIMTMLAGIVLGTGCPRRPLISFLMALLMPSIMKLGVIEPAAHMFAFYFAIFSAITPPVALAVFAAAGIAKSDIWTTGWAAMKIGAAGFIMPFMFVYEPALLMIGDWPTIITSLSRQA